MRYDIEADWQLLNTCNYRCSYCFFPPAMLGEKLQAAATPQAWQRAIDATGLTWLLHLTGGEPSIYPGFAELAGRLTQRHFVSMNSNLSQPSIEAFADTVDPARITFINAGLHPEERSRRAGLPVFLRNAQRLLDRGFPLFVSVVATPAVLAEPGRICDQVGALGLTPFPKLLQGAYQGRNFPWEYTPAERASFARFAAIAKAANAARMATWPEPPSIDVRLDDILIDSMPPFTGQACEAGRRFVRLEGDGSAFRCSTQTPLGNVLDGTLSLHRGPAACDTQYCHYFCRKYTAMAAQPALELA